MSTPVPTSTTTDALLERLGAAGLAAGDGRKPDGAGWAGAAGGSVFAPYVVLHPLATLRQGPDASIKDRNTDPVFRFQITAVGCDRLQAESAADLAAQALLTVPLEITGRAQVLLIHETSLGVAPDESVNPPVYTAVDRYRLDTSTP